MKKILLAALAASAMFSCNSKEIDGTGNQDGTSSVVIKLEQTDLTKGVTPEKGDPEYAVIKSAVIYFIDGGGNKVYQRELTAAEVTTIANTTTTAGDNEIEIAGIPNTAETLYFLANTKTVAEPLLPAIAGTGSAEARLRIDDLQGDAVNAPMAGQSGIFALVPGTTTSFTTSVTISPIVSRIEVSKIICDELDPTAATSITSYKLTGVYVNYTRPNVLIAGTPYAGDTPGDIRNQSGWGTAGWDSYLTNNFIFPYYSLTPATIPTGWKNNTFVDYCTPPTPDLMFYPSTTTGSTNVEPADKPAWAYQVCPAAIGADLPHLIFKLEDVDYRSNPDAAATEYLTVTKYQTEVGAPITAFERGNVYRIKELKFTHENATPKPYEKNVTVTATVTVDAWVLNTMVPDWD